MIKINHLHYTLALGCLLSLASCSNADSPQEKDFSEGNFIKFRTNLSQSTTTRGSAFEEDKFDKFNVTAFLGNTASDSYFNDIEFTKAEDNTYHSPNKYVWPNTNMDFFAYYPTSKDYEFDVVSGENVIYKLKNFNIAKNIADHIDFVASYAHSDYNNRESSVFLQFFHQLSQIKIEGIYNPDENVPYDYTVEVAGVKIGHAPVKGTFNFNNTNTPYASALNDGTWELGNDSYGVVEYTYTPGEKIIKLDRSETPESLMGNGGNAILIPAQIQKWDAKGNASNKNEGELKGGIYLSVLIRVTKTVDGKALQLYPAKGLNDNDQTAIVEIPVDANGNKVVESGDNIKQFGWAAVPVTADWKPGKRYVYTLNYSKGVGLRDPEDPNHPGDPILGGELQVTVGLEPWTDDKDFNGSIDIKDEISNKDNGDQGDTTE